jgi:ABC-2 type transport system permease protein
LVLCGFLMISGLMWYFVFFNYVDQGAQLVFNPYGASQLKIADYLLQPFYGNVSVVLLMIAPAISMRLFAEEYKSRTIELLYTSPVSTLEIVLGKYLGAMGFVSVLLLCTLYMPISLMMVAEPDLGLIASCYLGLLCLSGSIIAMGTLFSAITKNQIVALVLTFALGLGLFLTGMWSQDPDAPSVMLSIITHLEGMLRGEPKASDFTYFAGFIGFFLFVTHQRIEAVRWT